MSVYRTWRDFVIYPKDPGRVQSEAERLDVSRAVPLTQFKPTDPAARMDMAFFTRSPNYSNIFEAMEIDERGNIVFWMQDVVWVLVREFGMEKPIAMPRNPYQQERVPQKMTEYNTFRNFVVYPDDPEFVYSHDQRVDTRGAVPFSEYRPGMSSMAIDETYFTSRNERFEVMMVGQYGHVAIWTDKNAWAIGHRLPGERLIPLPRNPPEQPPTE